MSCTKAPDIMRSRPQFGLWEDVVYVVHQQENFVWNGTDAHTFRYLSFATERWRVYWSGSCFAKRKYSSTYRNRYVFVTALLMCPATYSSGIESRCGMSSRSGLSVLDRKMVVHVPVVGTLVNSMCPNKKKHKQTAYIRVKLCGRMHFNKNLVSSQIYHYPRICVVHFIIPHVYCVQVNVVVCICVSSTRTRGCSVFLPLLGKSGEKWLWESLEGKRQQSIK